MSRSTPEMIASAMVFFSLSIPSLLSKRFSAGRYGEEFEENFAVSTLGNSSNLTDAIRNDAGAELVEPPEDDITITLELQPEKVIARSIPTLDWRPRSRADALPQKPAPAGNSGGSLSYSAQAAEQFSSSCRHRLARNRGALGGGWRSGAMHQWIPEKGSPPPSWSFTRSGSSPRFEHGQG